MGNGLKTHRCEFTGEGIEVNASIEQTTLLLRCNECGQRGTIKMNSHFFPQDLLLRLCK